MFNLSNIKETGFRKGKTFDMLTDEETYKFLYEDNQDLEAYYKAARIGRNVQNILKSNANMLNTEINDILFYVIYAVVAQRMEKRELTFEDIKVLDIESITDEDIISVADKIYARYKELGGDSRIVKSKTFIEEFYAEFDL